MENPFKIVQTENGPMPVGRTGAVGVPDLGPEGIETVIGTSDGSGCNAVMKVSGVLWEPSEGSVLQLGEPERDAQVGSQYYMVLQGKLASVVCVHDPALGS